MASSRGSDSIASNGLRSFHRNDTHSPVDPADLTVRLRAAGFDDVEIAVAPEDEWFSFAARRP